jgi:hypothetical protein
MLFHVSRASEAGLEKRHVLYAELAHCEARLVDTGRLGTRSQDVGLDGDVVGICYSLHLVEEAVGVSREQQYDVRNVLWRRIHEVELARVLQHPGHAWVAPHGGDGLSYPHV